MRNSSFVALPVLVFAIGNPGCSDIPGEDGTAGERTQQAIATNIKSESLTTSVTCTSLRDQDLAALLQREITQGVNDTIHNGDRVAVAFYDRLTETVCESDATRHFKSASSIKASILGGLLLKAQTEGNRNLDRIMPANLLQGNVKNLHTEYAVAELMITHSDNDAGNALWFYLRRDSEFDWVQLFLDQAGMNDTKLPAPTQGWGDSLISARDQMQLVKAFSGDASPLVWKQRKVALDFTARSQPGGWWGITADPPRGTRPHVKIGIASLDTCSLGPIHYSCNLRVHSVGFVDGYSTSGNVYDYGLVLLSENNDDGDDKAKARLNTIGRLVNEVMTAIGGVEGIRTLQYDLCGPSGGQCDPTTRDQATEDLLSRILAFTPDFVTLNEVCRSQFDALTRELTEHNYPMDTRFAPTRASDPGCPGGGEVGNALFSFTPFTEQNGVALPAPDVETRRLLCGRTQVTLSNNPVLACSTQLSEVRERTAAQAAGVASFLDQAASGPISVMVGGDFGVRPEDTALDPLYNRSYLDIDGAAIPPSEDDNWGNCALLEPTCRSGEPTFIQRIGHDIDSDNRDYNFLNTNFAYLEGKVQVTNFSNHRALLGRSIIQSPFYRLVSSSKPLPGPFPGRNLPPAVSAGPNVLGNEGDAISLSGSVFDVDSTPRVSWSYVAGANVDPGATCSFENAGAPRTIITCTDDGTFIVTLTADDGVNGPVSDSAVVAVHNVAPTLTIAAPSAWQVQRAGTSVKVTAPFTDPGTNDTHTCAIDWDDGTTETFAATSSRCERAHTFAHAGMYTLAVTVTDDDGGASVRTVLFVVYDPNAGFVTGGGQIASQPGALISDPAAAGRGHFQFHAMYHKRDEGPAPGNGKVQFRLDGTTFDFASTHLDWLVVTQDGKAAIKGAGTLADKSGFGFVLYAYDANDDKYRLVAWPLTAGSVPPEIPNYDSHRGGNLDHSPMMYTWAWRWRSMSANTWSTPTCRYPEVEPTLRLHQDI